jgi:hypothetical protein
VISLTTYERLMPADEDVGRTVLDAALAATAANPDPSGKISLMAPSAEDSLRTATGGHPREEGEELFAQVGGVLLMPRVTDR